MQLIPLMAVDVFYVDDAGHWRRYSMGTRMTVLHIEQRREIALSGTMAPCGNPM